MREGSGDIRMHTIEAVLISFYINVTLRKVTFKNMRSPDPRGVAMSD